MTKARTLQLHVTPTNANWLLLVYREARRVAGTICHDDDIADDLTHNLVVELLNKKKPPEFITTWWLIARLRSRWVNFLQDERRRIYTFVPLAEENFDPDADDPPAPDHAIDRSPSAEQHIWLKQLEKAVRLAISALPNEEMQRIIWLRCDEATDVQIAAVIGKSANVAMTRRLEAEAILQVALAAYSDGRPPPRKSLRRKGRALKQGLRTARALAAE